MSKPYLVAIPEAGETELLLCAKSEALENAFMASLCGRDVAVAKVSLADTGKLMLEPVQVVSEGEQPSDLQSITPSDTVTPLPGIAADLPVLAQWLRGRTRHRSELANAFEISFHLLGEDGFRHLCDLADIREGTVDLLVAALEKQNSDHVAFLADMVFDGESGLVVEFHIDKYTDGEPRAQEDGSFFRIPEDQARLDMDELHPSVEAEWAEVLETLEPNESCTLRRIDINRTVVLRHRVSDMQAIESDAHLAEQARPVSSELTGM